MQNITLNFRATTALVSVSTGIDSEADVTAFAATEARLLLANNCEKKLNILEEGERLILT